MIYEIICYDHYEDCTVYEASTVAEAEERAKSLRSSGRYMSVFIEQRRKEYKYGMRLRGFSIGCQPLNGFLRRENDTTGKYFDVLVYERELTDREVEQYELDRL